MIPKNLFRKKNLWTPDILRVVILRVMDEEPKQKGRLEKWFEREMRREGHLLVDSRSVPKDFIAIGAALSDATQKHLADMILVSGGTGLSRSDITIEACSSLFHKQIPSFGAIFSTLLFQERGASALLERASAGTIGECLVFCMPGDLKACKLACYDLIFPEAREMLDSIRKPAHISPMGTVGS